MGIELLSGSAVAPPSFPERQSRSARSAIEVPQPRNDHLGHWDLDVGARLIEDDKSGEAIALRDAHARGDLDRASRRLNFASERG
jgi:hypothetical protein